MAREAKTNAMRMLDRQKIAYTPIPYDCPVFIDGVTVAEKTGAPLEASFKTLTAKGPGGYCVLVLPVAEEADLKKAAAALGQKSIALLPVKELQSVTGYIRGGCSPIGMKKAFPVLLDESALSLDEIYVSGGRPGLSIRMKVTDLIAVTNAKTAPICF